ncbi:MAG: type I-B CRISPR-associated protein Cas7/Cst2/DevR [Archaeoglobaceae archaeon]
MRFVVGLVLVDAPHSALNMFGIDQSVPDRNITRVKKFRRGRDQYPYVSPQAWRYWWRETLRERFNWELSPLFREEKQVFTSANPVKYPDDDVFGYMRAYKVGNKNVSVTRVSPLKTTPLVSILPERSSVTVDEGFASRHEGDPVPYSQEFYSTILKGAFSLDLDSVGRFSILDKSGFKNILKAEEIPAGKGEEAKNIKSEFDEMTNLAKKLEVTISTQEWIMPSEIRKKRAVDTIKALKFIFGGAKLAQYLTDVSPKFIILAMVEGGINPFISGIFYEDKGEVKFDSNALKSRILDLKEIFNPKTIHIGKDDGFMPEWNNDLDNLCKDDKLKEEEFVIKLGTVGSAIEEFTKEIEQYYEPVKS